MEKSVVVRAPINIALIKYWGKRHKKLIIPWNDSISLTINDFYAEATIKVSTELSADSVIINGDVIDHEKSSRFLTVFNEFRRLVFGKEDGPPFISVNSVTNFATSAGLASSAAGFASIAFGLGRIGGLDHKTIVKLARIGSGSACRSVLDGFVHWIAGSKSDSDEETGCEIIPCHDRWKKLKAIVFEFKNSSKKVSSTEGMERTAETSELFKYRINKVVPDRVERLKTAIKNGDFEELAHITMADSNQLHAICMDSQPPLIYLNDNSRSLIDFVVNYNEQRGSTLAAYTFDAGPNCCVFIDEENVEDFIREFNVRFRVSTDIRNGADFTLPLKQYRVSNVGGGPSLFKEY